MEKELFSDKVKEVVDSLKEYYQYEDIPYTADFICPHCGKSGDGYHHVPGDGYVSLPKGNLIGWCSTTYGYQMIFECPICFEKFRYHNCTTERSDFKGFAMAMWLEKEIEKDYGQKGNL